MSEYSVQQQKIINQYRQSNNLGFVISDDEVVSIMQKEMQKTGKVYPGFEFLAKSLKNHNSQSPLLRKSNNVFGSGFVKDKNLGISVERKVKDYAIIQPTPQQTVAIDFLKNITSQASLIVNERDNESGALSEVVNTWQELFNKEYSRSFVRANISKTLQDIDSLEKSAKGEPLSFDLLGNPMVSSFEETFKRTRGVAFSEKNINDCKQKAEKFAQVKTAVEMIQRTKQNLAFATKGDLKSQISPENSSRAIIGAFNLSGVRSVSKINETLTAISEKYKNHPYVKKYGGEFKLAKNTKGEYVIYRRAKNGDFAKLLMKN